MIGLMIAAMALPMLQDIEQMRVKASTEDATVREFETSCMARYLTAKDVETAAKASKRSYSTPSVGDGGRVTTWFSPYGILQFVKPQSGHVARCTMTGFTALAVSKRDLEGELLEMFARRYPNVRVSELEEKGQRSWFWMDGAGNPVRVIPVVSGKTPQQILLVLESVQNPS